MTTPKKDKILLRSKAIAMEREVRAGLPAITPTERELKETGVYSEAKLDLMRVDQGVLSEQRRYFDEMAGELRLKIIPKRGLAVLKRETGYEWTDGWHKHERKPTKPKKPSKPTVHIRSISKEDYTKVSRLWEKHIGIPSPYFDIRRKIEKKGLTRERAHEYAIFHSYRKMKKEVEAVMGKPKPKQKLPTSIGEVMKQMKTKPKKGKIKKWKPKKRKKSHVECTGKTMRALRKVNGVKMFSFPDSVWKVRKPRKKRKRK